MPRYIYRSDKPNTRVHVLDADNKTFCKMENSTAGALLNEVVDSMPEGRSLCSMCDRLSQKPKRPPKQTIKKPGKPSGFYASWEWAEVRYATIKRFGAVCMCCNATKDIVVDHIKPRSRFPEMELSLDNLQVLCRLCNRGKGAHDMTDWRSPEQRAQVAYELAERLTPEAEAHMRLITTN